MTKPLAHLNRLLHEDLARRYPEIPERLLPNKPMKATKANDLTKAVIKYIQLMGGQAERISVTGRRVDNTKTYTDVLGYKRQIGSTKFIKSSMQRGSADISATIKNKNGIGISVKIEIKVGKDRQSDVQKIYQDQVERAGGVYLLCHSFDQFFEWYNDFIK